MDPRGQLGSGRGLEQVAQVSFTSTTQPLCRYCGKPIKKRTHTVFFGQGFLNGGERRGQYGFSDQIADKPRTKADAQRHSNYPIVSMSWHYAYTMGSDVGIRDYIDKVSVWDGISYEAEFFCTGEHAQRFAHVCARDGRATEAYNKAKRAQIAARAA